MVALLLTLTVGCKKETDKAIPAPAPAVETLCQLKRTSFGMVGESIQYEQDGNGRTTKIWPYYADDKGKVPTTVNPTTITYNAQGLAERFGWSDGTGYDLLSYTNSALSKIDVFFKNKKVYQYDVTTNAAKQITGMKATSLDPDNFGSGYSTAYTLDAQGRYTQVEVKDEAGKVFFRTVMTGFESGMKGYYDTWKANGLMIDPNTPSNQYGYYLPVGNNLRLKDEDYWGYDDAGNFVGLKKISEWTFARKANSNKFAIERIDVEAISKTTDKSLYSYTNCN